MGGAAPRLAWPAPALRERDRRPGAMLQLRDSVDVPSGPGEAGAAALLVPASTEVPFTPPGELPPSSLLSPPPRQTLRPLSVRNPTRGGRLKEYFVFRVGGGWACAPPPPRTRTRSL